jgi:hypothetical protein
MSENKGTKMKISVKDIKRGRMYEVPDPIDEDALSEDERETLNHMAGTDPHFWGPGYDE